MHRKVHKLFFRGAGTSMPHQQFHGFFFTFMHKSLYFAQSRLLSVLPTQLVKSKRPEYEDTLIVILST